MEKAHSNINWVDFPNISTPLASRILNKQDHEIDEIDNRVVEMDTTKAKESDRLLMISDVDLNMENGVLTVTRANGTKKTYDTSLEKIAVNFRFDYATQSLIIELPDGTEQSIDMSALITQYEFSSTSTISFNVGSDGKVSAFIPNGAVKKENLDTDYLAEIEGQVNMAESYAEQSQNSANASSSASVLAEEYAEQARIYKDQAFSGTPQGYEALVVDVSNLESFVNPKTFGAAGDGVTDDTQAFKSAIENAESNGLSIFIPEGRYLITDRLIISRSMTFKGASHDNTIIIFKGSYHNETPYVDDYYEESNAAICLKAYNCTLEDFTLIGSNVSVEPSKENRSLCNGIIMHYPITLEDGRKVYTGCERVRLSNIDIKYFKSGLFFYGGWNRYIERVQCIDCDYGVKYYPLELDTVGEWTASGDIWLACSMIGNVIAGFYGKAIFQTCIWNSVFEYNNRAIYIDNCPDIVFKNCWNEANSNKLYVKGSAKFEGGYNINKGTVEHELIGGQEIVQFENSSTILMCREGNIIFEQIAGVIVKGVDIGAEVENLIGNPAFSEASGGTGSVASFLGWEVYPSYVGSINEDTEPYNAQISVSDRDGDDLFFGIRTTVPVEYGTNYTIRFEALTPDRSLIDRQAYIFITWKSSDGTVLLYDNQTFEFIGNDAWEEKEISITPIGDATQCEIGFGLGRNGTIKIKNPLFTYSDSAVRNNVYTRRDTENPDIVNFLDISGNLISSYNKNNVLTKDDIPTIVEAVIEAMSN